MILLSENIPEHGLTIVRKLLDWWRQKSSFKKKYVKNEIDAFLVKLGEGPDYLRTDSSLAEYERLGGDMIGSICIWYTINDLPIPKEVAFSIEGIKEEGQLAPFLVSDYRGIREAAKIRLEEIS